VVPGLATPHPCTPSKRAFPFVLFEWMQEWPSGPLVVDTQYTILVAVRDAYTNVVPCTTGTGGTAEQLELSMAGVGSLHTSCVISPTDPWFYQIDFIPTTSGNLLATVRLRTSTPPTDPLTPQDNVRRSPVFLDVVPAAPHPLKSSFEAPNEMTADTPAVVWVTLRDTHENIVPCTATDPDNVDLTTTNSWLDVTSSDCPADDWRVRIVVLPKLGGQDASADVGQRDLHVKLAQTPPALSGDIGSLYHVQVRAGAIEASECLLSPTSLNLKAGESAMVTVRARDLVCGTYCNVKRGGSSAMQQNHRHACGFVSLVRAVRQPGLVRGPTR